MYEMLVGRPPFYQEDQDDMFSQILGEEVQFPEDIELSPEVKDFITALLYKNPKERLGANGYEEVIQHHYFGNIDIKQIANKELEAPFKPPLTDDKFDI
mmetsp:Transcript_27163/g.26211  ORF Transcript_27163/g.26211 Transcript_27163/m.26211 type:complete len:99 (-) Transcript_27163:48-344(-)